jgi:creatinine amidohydrolase/Fe(II)-dependent formamide hydrolase-like protein
MRDEFPSGVLGAPRYASAERGLLLFAAIVEQVAASIDTVADHPNRGNC